MGRKFSGISFAGSALPSTGLLVGYDSTGPTDLAWTRAQVAAGVQAVYPSRLVLLANTTIYVSTTGDDSSGTGLVGNPYATLVKAWTVIGQIDTNGYTVTIQLADGTYSGLQVGTGGGFGGNAQGGPVGNGPIVIQGNTSDATKVVISDANNPFNFGAPAGSEITIKWLTVASAGSAHWGIGINGPATVRVAGSVIFSGVFAYAPLFCAGMTSLLSISASGAHTVSNSGAGDSLFWVLSGYLELLSASFTASGGPTYNTIAQASSAGVISTYGATFFGTFNGSRYNSDANSVINTFGEGATYFPGTAGGTTSNGGIYL